MDVMSLCVLVVVCCCRTTPLAGTRGMSASCGYAYGRHYLEGARPHSSVGNLVFGSVIGQRSLGRLSMDYSESPTESWYP
jgi:hypothetical protein